MLNKKTFRRLYILMISISLALLSIVVLTVFEYSAVAEVREYFTATDEQSPLEYGKLLFETRGCASCHTIVPDQKSLGPNLWGVAQRQPQEYIRQSIVNPEAVIVEGYEDIIMPNFGTILNEDQVNALVTYLVELDK